MDLVRAANPFAQEARRERSSTTNLLRTCLGSRRDAETQRVGPNSFKGPQKAQKTQRNRWHVLRFNPSVSAHFVPSVAASFPISASSATLRETKASWVPL